jgi:hypothetical protein
LLMLLKKREYKTKSDASLEDNTTQVGSHTVN